MPRVRYGKVHVLNSYYNSDVSNKCIAAGFKANILVENNFFEKVKNPISLMDSTAIVTQTGNKFTSVSGTTEERGTAFSPPYTVTKLSADAVKVDVTSKPGATLTGNVCGW